MPASNASIINLTPHTINVIVDNGETVDIQPSGQVARVAATTIKKGEISGLPIFESLFGEVEGLPPRKLGTFYIVSRLVLQACSDRDDLLAPGQLVRDEEGRPIGCKVLSR